METFEKILFYVLAVIVINAIFAFPIMWIWNMLMPSIGQFVRIDWGQGFWLATLGSLLTVRRFS